VVKGTQVIFDDVPVGQVASAVTAAGHGADVVTLHIIPGRARSIPANVTAEVEPVTIFGTEDLVLVAPAHPAAARLTAGAVLQPTGTAGGANLQGTVTSLDYILRALHPAQLDIALTAIASALQGQGKGLGRTLSDLDQYLKVQLPHFPLLEQDLGLIAPLADQIARSAPALVGSLSNLAVPSRELTSQARNLHAALTEGAVALSHMDSVLAPTQQALRQIIDAAGPFFRDLSLSPTELAQILHGLNAWAVSWSSAERSGPYLSFSSSVPIANATDLVFAALGNSTCGDVTCAAGALGPGHVDPPTYTSRAVPIDESSVQIDPAVVSPDEAQHDAVLADDLNGNRQASPAVASLLINPLLTQMAVGS